MSLWDRDTRGDSRLTPRLTGKDLNANRMAHGTMGFTLKQDSDGDIAYLSVKDGRFQVYKADGTLIVQGGVRDSDQDGAFDVAKPGSELS